MSKTKERYETVAERIERLVYDKPGCTSLLIGSKTGYSKGAVYRVLRPMVEAGRLEAKTEGDKFRHYYLPERLTPNDQFLQDYEEVESYEPPKDPSTREFERITVTAALNEYEDHCNWWGAEPSYDKFRSWVEKHL